MMNFVATLLMMLAAGTACHAEVLCFRTPAQAAVQVGDAEGGGYRLDFVRQDVHGGRHWAAVRSCAHPEWPPLLVASVLVANNLMAGGPAKGMPAPSKAEAVPVTRGQAEVLGGRIVRVIEVDGMARLELTGIAQGSGSVGDPVAVRLLTSGNGEGRVVRAVVRGTDVLEVVR